MNTQALQDFYSVQMADDTLWIVLSASAVLAAMVVDLVTGVHKAKLNGEACTSTGLKKTASKARKYFMPLLALVCIDLIGCILLPAPIFTMAWAAFCVFCEFVSIREKAWQKAELRRAEMEAVEAAKTLAPLLRAVRQDPALVEAALEALTGANEVHKATITPSPSISEAITKEAEALTP